jgi:hypothetical protein
MDYIDIMCMEQCDLIEAQFYRFRLFSHRLPDSSPSSHSQASEKGNIQ